MNSTISYQLANAHTADLQQRAARERVARAAARAAQPPHRTRPLPVHIVTAATHRVLGLFGARPWPAR